MDTETNSVYSERLTWGLVLLAAALLVSMILSIYSFANLGLQVDEVVSASTQMNPLTTAVGCLPFLSGILAFIGFILVLIESRRLTGAWQAFTTFALAAYILSIVMIVVSMVLSFGATLQGDLSSFYLMTWLSAAGSLLSFLAFFLVILPVAPGWAKGVLVFGLLIFIVNLVGISYLTTSHVTLKSYELMGSTLYLPDSNIDKSTGLYPILSGLGIVSSLLYALMFAALSVISWLSAPHQLPDTVA